jgi:hypothetical protein
VVARHLRDRLGLRRAVLAAALDEVADELLEVVVELAAVYRVGRVRVAGLVRPGLAAVGDALAEVRERERGRAVLAARLAERPQNFRAHLVPEEAEGPLRRERPVRRRPAVTVARHVGRTFDS